MKMIILLLVPLLLIGCIETKPITGKQPETTALKNTPEVQTSVSLENFKLTAQNHTLYKFPPSTKIDRSFIFDYIGNHYLYSGLDQKLYPVGPISDSLQHAVIIDNSISVFVPAADLSGFFIHEIQGLNITDGPFIEHPIGEILDFVFFEGRYYVVVVSSKDWNAYVLIIQDDKILAQLKLLDHISADRLNRSFRIQANHLYVIVRGAFVANISEKSINYFEITDGDTVGFADDKIIILNHNGDISVLDSQFKLMYKHKIPVSNNCEECRINFFNHEEVIILQLGKDIFEITKSTITLVDQLDFVPYTAKILDDLTFLLVNNEDGESGKLIKYTLTAKESELLFEQKIPIVDVEIASGDIIFIDDQNNGYVLKNGSD